MPNQPERSQPSASLNAAVALAHDPDRPYLGDVTVVHDLVRDHAGSIVDVVQELQDKDLSQEEFQDRIVGLCKKMALIFLGKDKDYSGMADFNREGILDAVLRRHFEYTDPAAEDVLLAHFMGFSTKTLSVLQRAHAEMDEEWKEVAERLIANFTKTLMGERVNF
jgi:hypothetical protein